VPLRACLGCGRPTRDRRCPDCRLPPRPRGNAFEPTRQRIAERDGWRCAICHEPIDPSLKRPHPMALHVGHVTARVEGGADRDANYAATHADCNLRLGTRQIEEAR
jgi:hypothetical protein